MNRNVFFALLNAALAQLESDPWIKLHVKQNVCLGLGISLNEERQHVTTIGDFPLALQAVDQLLAKYAVHKGDEQGTPKWRRQDVLTHLNHADVHLTQATEFVAHHLETSGQEEDLLSAATRMLMALQLYLEAKQHTAAQA